MSLGFFEKLLNKISKAIIILVIALFFFNYIKIINISIPKSVLIITLILFLRLFIIGIFLKILEFKIDVLIFRKKVPQKYIRKLFDKYERFGKYILSPEFLYLFYFDRQWCWMLYQILNIQRKSLAPFWNRDKTNLDVDLTKRFMSQC